MIFQSLANGLVTGSIYAIAALGFAMVYNTTHIFHIAYAAIYMFAPYMLYSFSRVLGLPLLPAILIAVLLTIVLSLVSELFVYQPLKKKGSSGNVMMVSSIGFMIVIINVIALFYGNETKIISQGLSESFQLSSIIITKNQLIQFIISISLTAGFILFLNFSKFGLRTRTIRDDEELSKIFGIQVERTRMKIFMLSGLFIGVAGCLVSIDVGMDPYVGMPMLLNAVVAVIVGGKGRFVSPMLGGFIIGVLQALTVYFFESRWENAVTFIILILFLLIRPQGIMGERQRIT